MSEADPPSSDSPEDLSPKAIRSAVESKADPAQAPSQQRGRSQPSAQQRKEDVFLKAQEEHYEHKNIWSWFLLGALIAIFIAQTVFMLLVGVKWLDFTSYPGLFQLYIVQSLVQIVGLAAIALRSLFKDIHYPGAQRSRKRRRRRTRREAYHT